MTIEPFGRTILCLVHRERNILDSRSRRYRKSNTKGAWLHARLRGDRARLFLVRRKGEGGKKQGILHIPSVGFHSLFRSGIRPYPTTWPISGECRGGVGAVGRLFDCVLCSCGMEGNGRDLQHNQYVAALFLVLGERDTETWRMGGRRFSVIGRGGSGRGVLLMLQPP